MEHGSNCIKCTSLHLRIIC